VPVRCTLFVDTSQSVRVGAPGENALTRLVMIGAAVAQATAGARDLTGLCLFDEQGVTTYLRPARSSRHLAQVVNLLADAAALAPATGEARVQTLLPLAHALAQEVYPDLMRPELNHLPAWLTWLAPQRAYTNPSPTLADRIFGWLPFWLLALSVLGGVLAFTMSFTAVVMLTASLRAPVWVSGGVVGFGWLLLSPLIIRLTTLLFARRRQQQRWRKRVAALLSVRYGLAPGGLAVLMEDDQRFSLLAQRFLAEHHVPYPLPYYDRRGRYLFTSAGKAEVLAGALLRAVGKGRDNELFVLLADLLELTDELEPLLRAVKVTLARHHQVLIVCPWPPGVPPPERSRPQPLTLQTVLPLPQGSLRATVQRSSTVRFHQAFQRLRQTFIRLGVPVVCARSGDPVRLILERLDRLRVLGRRR
jgi:hypothetical protein